MQPTRDPPCALGYPGTDPPPRPCRLCHWARLVARGRAGYSGGTLATIPRGPHPVTLGSAAKMTQALSRSRKEAFAPWRGLIRVTARAWHRQGALPAPRCGGSAVPCPRPGVACRSCSRAKARGAPPRSWVSFGARRPGLGPDAVSRAALRGCNAAPACSHLFAVTRGDPQRRLQRPRPSGL